MMSFKRVILYAVGLLFMAFGVAFSVNSNLGVSPVNSLPYVISKIIHMDLGNESSVICALLVGKIMKPLKKVIDPMIQKFCFQK